MDIYSLNKKLIMTSLLFLSLDLVHSITVYQMELSVSVEQVIKLSLLRYIWKQMSLSIPYQDNYRL